MEPYEPRLHPFCSSGKRSFCSRCEYVLSVRTDARSLYVVEGQVIGQSFLGSFVSLLLASKHIVSSHIYLGVFCGFCIISFNKLVNVAQVDERAFDQKFGTLSIPGDFHFWDLVNVAFNSITVTLSHSCSFTFSFHLSIFPAQLADILEAFFLSPYPLPELFYTVLRWYFFYHNLIFPHFFIEFFGIRLEDLILPVEFVTFIKSSFPLCSYLYFLL